MGDDFKIEMVLYSYSKNSELMDEILWLSSCKKFFNSEQFDDKVMSLVEGELINTSPNLPLKCSEYSLKSKFSCLSIEALKVRSAVPMGITSSPR